jgi:hypothetical protein
LLRKSLLACQEVGDVVGVARGIAGLAELALRHGDARRAVCLYSASKAVRSCVGIVNPPIEYDLDRQIVEIGLHDLGEEQFSTAWRAGEHMPLDRAIAEALQERSA